MESLHVQSFVEGRSIEVDAVEIVLEFRLKDKAVGARVSPGAHHGKVGAEKGADRAGDVRLTAWVSSEQSRQKC